MASIIDISPITIIQRLPCLLLPPTRAAAVTTAPAAQPPSIIASISTPALRRSANTSHITRFYLYTEPDSGRRGGDETRSLYGERRPGRHSSHIATFCVNIFLPFSSTTRHQAPAARPFSTFPESSLGPAASSLIFSVTTVRRHGTRFFLSKSVRGGECVAAV